MKFYAVKSEEENKIFTSWDECKLYLSGKKGYKQKAFSSRAEAEAFLRGEDIYADALKADLAAGYCVCYTDGSFEAKRNAYSFGVVAIAPDGCEYEFCGSGNDPVLLSSRNVAGEADGVLAAVKWAFVGGYPKVRVYHDYAGLSAWADGSWASRSPISERYCRELAKYRGGIKIEFVKVKGHSNVLYNERVDKLAKKALFENYSLPVSGYGFKISGVSEAKSLAEKVNKLAPKAAYSFTDDGTTFTLGGEKLGIYARGAVTVVAGSGGALYFLAVNEILKTADGTNKKRVFENAFGVEAPDIPSGIDFSRALLQSGKFPPRLVVLFALESVIEVIKIRLKGQNIVCEKPSKAFAKNDDGSFSLTFPAEAKEKKLLEKAYGFLFKHRSAYPEAGADEKTVKKIIDEAAAIVEAE